MDTGKVRMRFRGESAKEWKDPDKDKLLRIIDQLRGQILAGKEIEHFEISKEIKII